MGEISRRAFLSRSAMAAGAAAVAAASLPQAARASTSVGDADAGTGASPVGGEAVVAYVRPNSGEVTVMVGEREIVAHDRELARRIRRAAR